MAKPSASLDLAPLREPYAVAVAAVLGAAMCWSLVGVAYRLILDEYAISPLTVIALRASTAAVAVGVYVVLREGLRRQLRTAHAPGNLALLFCAGTISVTGFNIALIYTFELAGVAVGTVLLYFAPSIVAVGAWLGFKHRISIVQRVALVVSLCGVVGVAGILRGADNVHVAGIVLGIVAALGYASYSLVGQLLLSTYHPLVIVGVSQTVGAVTAWVVSLIVEGPLVPEIGAIIWVVGVTGILTTLIPMVLYTWGLSKLGPQRASLLTTVEPVLAVGLAFAVLGETLTPLQLGGSVLIVGSVVLAASERVRS